MDSMPNCSNLPFYLECPQRCTKCPLYGSLLDSGHILCDELSKEQINWIIENADELKRWLMI